MAEERRTTDTEICHVSLAYIKARADRLQVPSAPNSGTASLAKQNVRPEARTKQGIINYHQPLTKIASITPTIHNFPTTELGSVRTQYRQLPITLLRQCKLDASVEHRSS